MTDLYVKGPVLAPGMIGRPELGVTDRPLTPEEIQKAAYQFLPGTPLVDEQHEFKQVGDVVESYITPEITEFNNREYPVGTWFLTAKVTDPNTKQQVQSGILKGFSAAAFPEKFGHLIPKGMFSDVKEGEWFSLAVSLVKMPFYPEMIFKVFGPDDIIKKSFNSEVDTVGEGDNALAGIIGKLLDYVIKKESSDDGKQYETELEKKVRDLKEKDEENQKTIKKLEKKVDKLSEKQEEPPGEEETEDEEDDKEDKKKSKKTKKSKKGKKEKSKKSKDDEEETDDEDEEVDDDDEEEEVDEKEEKIIKKGLSPDNKKTNPAKSFNERAGMDPLGRNPKYL